MVAILSDIHGNRPALEAVFAEMEQLGVKRMLVLGDVTCEEFLIMLNIFCIYAAGWIDNYSTPVIFWFVLADVKKYFAKKSMVEILI